MIHKNVKKEAAIAAALAINNEQCNPPKPEAEIIDTVEDLCWRYPAGENDVEPIIPKKYLLREDGLYWVQKRQNQQTGKWSTSLTRLSNFNANIKKEIISDDGYTQNRAYLIGGCILPSEVALPQTEVDVDKFPTMGWVQS